MQLSMVKVYATEMASDVIDHAMQTFGAMGMTAVGRGIPSGAAHIAQVRIWRSAFCKSPKIKKTKAKP